MADNIDGGAQSRRGRAPFDGTELIIPAGGVAFAVYYLSTISSLPWEAKMSGMFLGIAVLALAGLFFVRALLAVAAGRTTFSADEVFGSGALLVRRLGIVGLATLYVVLLAPLGFALATFLFLMAALALLGVRSVKHLLAVPFCLSAAGYLLFIVALDSDLPRGVVATSLDALFGLGG